VITAPVDVHNGEISTLSRSFFNWSRSIEDQGARTKDRVTGVSIIFPSTAQS
jgi:hypothetical protein